MLLRESTLAHLLRLGFWNSRRILIPVNHKGKEVAYDEHSCSSEAEYAVQRFVDEGSELYQQRFQLLQCQTQVSRYRHSAREQGISN
jgi:hypothetical protein